MIVTAGVIHSVAHWLYHALIFTWQDPSGYNFVSGPLPNITLIVGALAIVRHHNCHAKGCLRLGRHPVKGTGYIVCRKHHPDAAPTAEQIHAEHAAAQTAASGLPDSHGTTTSTS